MKVFGVLFLILGVVVAVLGFGSYASDIQLGIGFTGINMAGIGGIMLHLSKTG
jgi:hypothetical protein